jgi:hypothetical protein
MISIENPDGTIEPSVTLTVGTSLADNSKAETTYHSVIQRANVYTPIAVYLQHGKINKKRRKDGLQKSVLRHLNKK